MKPCCKNEREKTIEECIAAVRPFVDHEIEFPNDQSPEEIIKALQSLKASETLKETPK